MLLHLLKDCAGFAQYGSALERMRWLLGQNHRQEKEPGNPLAEETEFLICEIARQNKKIAEALRAQYLKPGTMQYKAKLLGYSSTQYKVYLEMGKQWLNGRFSGPNISF